MTIDALSHFAVSDDRRRLLLTWRDGAETTAPAPWLYDNADGACEAIGGNRLVSALALPGALSLADAAVEADAIRLRFEPCGEERRVRLSTLRPSSGGEDTPDLWATPEWAASASPIQFMDYLSDDAALAAVLRRVARRGIALLAGVGTEPGAVERAVARFGFIRETNYGRLFDVREEARPSHLAYTAVGLDLHTDNPYRDPVPTLQLLHAIEVSEVGGESTFADGFAHAEALRAAAPERFAALATTSVEFAYEASSGERYAARAPVIETDADGRVVCIRLNHRALRALPLDEGKAEAWYGAYLDFYQRLHAPAARLERRLAPGEMVIFDNRRLLHGRASYQAGGRRWLQGCYAERDGMLATLSRLTRSGVAAGK